MLVGLLLGESLKVGSFFCGGSKTVKERGRKTVFCGGRLFLRGRKAVFCGEDFFLERLLWSKKDSSKRELMSEAEENPLRS